jgi:hypothetical protein
MGRVQSITDIGEWLTTFQKRMNIIPGYEGIELTISIWREEKDDDVKHPKVEVVRSSHFSFLGMQMTWMEGGDLYFGVYLKPSQELKYFNSNSSHPP